MGEGVAHCAEGVQQPGGGTGVAAVGIQNAGELAVDDDGQEGKEGGVEGLDKGSFAEAAVREQVDEQVLPQGQGE